MGAVWLTYRHMSRYVYIMNVVLLPTHLCHYLVFILISEDDRDGVVDGAGWMAVLLMASNYPLKYLLFHSLL